MEEHTHSGPPTDQAYTQFGGRRQECRDAQAQVQRDRRAAKKSGLWKDGRANNGNAANFRHKIYKRLDYAIAASKKIGYQSGALAHGCGGDAKGRRECPSPAGKRQGSGSQSNARWKLSARVAAT